MKLELISYPLCPYVHRIAILLREKKVDFTMTYIDLSAKPDWFLKISPRGKVPVLVADGRPLFESAAIAEFLDETHPPRLLAEDPFERALERAWVEVASDLLAAQYRLFTAITNDQLAEARTAVDANLARIEDAITRGQIDPSKLGLVQVSMAPALYRFVVLGERLGTSFLAATPKVEAWARELAQRPSVRDAVPVDLADRYLALLEKVGSKLAA